jgi:hypothetical protein
MTPWILIAVFVLIILLAAVALVLRKGKQQKPSYKTFFIMGITWLPLGIVLDNYALTGMGVIFMVIGLLNRDKWEDEPKWADLPEDEKRLKMILVTGLSVLLVAGVFAFFFFR